MSHFVGIVFGPKEEVDYKLSPYDENLEVEPYIERSPKELLEWAKDYEKNMRDTINKYSESVEDNYKQERAKELMDSLHNQWHNFESKEDYKSLIEKHFNLDDKGNAISTYNPNSKWDWYRIGGRWNGDILHAGSYDTNQAPKKVLTQIKTPYCFIDLNGEWHERGTMGWWGMSLGEMDRDAWEKEFREYLDSLPEDTWLTVIDFHI